MQSTRLGSMLLVLASWASLAWSQENRPEPFDIVIRGGKIVDGTGNPWFEGDVAIRGDRIVAVNRPGGDLPARRRSTRRGLIVAPGFIDIHSHSDTTLLEDESPPSKVRQGVTTEILGEDTSAGPAKGKRPPQSWKRDGATRHVDDPARVLRRPRGPGHRRECRQLRGARNVARVHDRRLARPPRRCAAQDDERVAGRSDARRGARLVDDALEPARAGRHHR